MVVIAGRADMGGTGAIITCRARALFSDSISLKVRTYVDVATLS